MILTINDNEAKEVFEIHLHSPARNLGEYHLCENEFNPTDHKESLEDGR